MSLWSCMNILIYKKRQKEVYVCVCWAHFPLQILSIICQTLSSCVSVSLSGTPFSPSTSSPVNSYRLSAAILISPSSSVSLAAVPWMCFHFVSCMKGRAETWQNHHTTFHGEFLFGRISFDTQCSISGCALSSLWCSCDSWLLHCRSIKRCWLLKVSRAFLCMSTCSSANLCFSQSCSLMRRRYSRWPARDASSSNCWHKHDTGQNYIYWSSQKGPIKCSQRWWYRETYRPHFLIWKKYILWSVTFVYTVLNYAKAYFSWLWGEKRVHIFPQSKIC